MKIVIAPDSFKESLSAIGVANAIKQGFKQKLPSAEYQLLPVADGGEGTTEALVCATEGRFFADWVPDPLGRLVEARWGLLGDKNTAVIETAAASGLDCLTLEERNPLKACSAGTGVLIGKALDHGVSSIIIGLGGSATNDGGSGLLRALGAKMVDKEGVDIPAGGAALIELDTIDLSGLDSRLLGVELRVACDVDNPLIGDQGASTIFGPQKGASPSEVRQLEAALTHYAGKLQLACGRDVSQLAGGGAAGGIGAALLGCMDVSLQSGIDIVLDAIDFDEKVKGADLVITGEGRIDSQTTRGKAPIGVARRAKLQGCSVIAIAGSVAEDAEVVYQHGIDALFSVVPGVVGLSEAIAQAEVNITRASRNIAALWCC